MRLIFVYRFQFLLLLNIFEVLENEEKFYINEQGQVVISFDRYEIAPGYMGYPEFIINLPMEMNLNET